MKKIISLFIIIFSFKLSAQTSLIIKSTDSNVGVILGDVVNVRQKPGTFASIIDTVKENEYVRIIERTNEREKIGNFTENWVKVKTQKGKEGYIFGAFVFDLEKLYLNKWTQPNYARIFSTTVIFHKNNTYFRLIEDENCVESVHKIQQVNIWYDYKEQGSFVVQGRKISLFPLNQFIRQKSPKKTNWRNVISLSNDFTQSFIYKTLYLLKCSNENGTLLTKKLIALDLNTFCADYGGYHPVR